MSFSFIHFLCVLILAYLSFVCHVVYLALFLILPKRPHMYACEKLRGADQREKRSVRTHILEADGLSFVLFNCFSVFFPAETGENWVQRGRFSPVRSGGGGKSSGENFRQALNNLIRIH